MTARNPAEGIFDDADSQGELPTDPDPPAGRPLHLQPAALWWVFVGGVVGTGARYGVEAALPRTSSQWPWATLLINLVGAFLLGALLEGLARAGQDTGWRQRVRLCAGTGGCGAFTTYSTLALEASLLGREDHVVMAIGYGLISVVGGMVAAWLGIAVASGWHQRRSGR